MLQSFEPLILGFHFILCIFLIITILLQAGKGADIGAAFGAGSSQTLFGARGAATFLSKMTAIAAILFLVTSLTLSGIHKNRSLNGLDISMPETPAADTNAAPKEEPKASETKPEDKKE
ncbi:preprotein translocase subunit SecG [bacterium]|nr:preprotein translocase subunit SecG [bacterium]